jgi:L-iditol 2-dehydrogenase
MSEKMKAALFYGKKEDMRIETVDVPDIGDGDVLLKVHGSGICGSDARSYFNGIEERYKIPIIFGHELTAEIYRVGNRVTGYSPGERIVVAPIYGCGQCEFCVSGRENLCENVVVIGCTYDGGYAEYMVIPEKGVERGALVKIGENVSDAAGTMIEPMSCCLHGLRKLHIQPGDSVIVFGAGPIGLSHMILSKMIGGGRVGIIDMVESRLSEAEVFGADITINGASKTWEEEVRDFCGPHGADIVVTAAPSVSAVENGIKIVKSGGKLLIFGGLPHGSRWNMDPNIVHYREITIYGSIDATIDDFRRAAAMAPKLDLERFVTHTLPLEKAKEGMEIMRRKEGLKVIFDVSGTIQKT